jgi:hypothetical protein
MTKVSEEAINDCLEGTNGIALEVAQSLENNRKRMSEQMKGNTRNMKPPSDDPLVNADREKARRYQSRKRENHERMCQGRSPLPKAKLGAKLKPLSDDPSINERRKNPQSSKRK